LQTTSALEKLKPARFSKINPIFLREVEPSVISLWQN